MKLCIIGLGKIGTAMVHGILNSKLYSKEEIIGCDINVKNLKDNKKYENIETINDNVDGAKRADAILLAVKPQVIDHVLEEVSEAVKGKLVISIAAGISNSHLKEKLPLDVRTIRVMPNTPILVKAGISAVAAGRNATQDDIKLVYKIFSGVGQVVKVDEKLMDAITGLSGSGPAFIYIMIEALADGGVLTGISRELAIKLTAQTMLGSAKMVLETKNHPGLLKDMVPSPGGTSIRGIEVLEKHGIRGILIDAVKEATLRSKELNTIK
ncbi:MAG: pyrroline-5-carboxylate reductase [Halanaerobiales bacterium]|nr:pyrroline-5-carboxylate reductase [Halanaerobiales bacterium]